LLPWPAAVADTVVPGALDDFPCGGSALFVPVSGGVQAGSLPGFDCDPPPVPPGGLVEPVAVPLGGVVEPVPVPLGAGMVEPLPGREAVEPAPVDWLGVPAAAPDT
jgi:hypothetical protein